MCLFNVQRTSKAKSMPRLRECAKRRYFAVIQQPYERRSSKRLRGDQTANAARLFGQISKDVSDRAKCKSWRVMLLKLAASGYT